MQHPLMPIVRQFLEVYPEIDLISRQEWLDAKIGELILPEMVWQDKDGFLRLHPNRELDSLAGGIFAVLLHMHTSCDIHQHFQCIVQQVNEQYEAIWRQLELATLTQFHQKRIQTVQGQKRLPESAVEVLREWFDMNVFSPTGPYPDNEEKDILLLRTGLDIAAIDTWFTNMRRRDKLYLETCGLSAK